MGFWEIVCSIILLILALGIIIVVLLQEGQQQQVGAMPTSNSNTFYQQNKSRTVDAFLARCTTTISIGFALAVIIINVISFIEKN